MMSADQILTAHAKRTPTSYKHDDIIRPDSDPWWKCRQSIGGDLRKFTTPNKETK